AIYDRPGALDVDAVEGGREAVRIAFATDLAIGDHVDARALHVADREQRRVVLRGFEELGRDAPKLRRTDPRDLAAESRAVDQPGRLRVAADDRRLDHSNVLVWSVLFGVRSPASQRASSACASARRRAAISPTSCGSSVSSSLSSSGVA